MECEAVAEFVQSTPNGWESQPPRFSIGAAQALKDPRFCTISDLLGVAVCDNPVRIPSNWLMAHQYIYVVHENTDQFGWQYRSQWPGLETVLDKNEPWGPVMLPNSYVRRRIWMSTIVPRGSEFIKAKNLLSENLSTNDGEVRLQGELYRYEDGVASKTWQRRQVQLYHDRIEFFIGLGKKATLPIKDCEVQILFEDQTPSDPSSSPNSCFRKANERFSFSIYHPTEGDAILQAQSNEDRRKWVLAIQYLSVMNSEDMNHTPLEYGPPTGEYPDNRVCLSEDLKLLDKDGRTWIPRHFQLLPRELVYFDEEDRLRGRIFVDKASVQPITSEGQDFTVSSKSGVSLMLQASSLEQKNRWIDGVRKAVQRIKNHEQIDARRTAAEKKCQANVVQRISQFYQQTWVAPAVEGEDEDYLFSIFTAPYQDNPHHFEFSDELGIKLPPPSKPTEQPTATTANNTPEQPTATTNNTPEQPTAATTNNTLSQNVSRDDSQFQAQLNSYASSALPAIINPERNTINPQFVLQISQEMTHRLVLVLEYEYRKHTAPKEVHVACPARFNIGGPRTGQDPLSIPISALISISSRRPEVYFSPSWMMLYPYIYIVQHNTDDNGWQYRSTWSNGVTIDQNDEPWSQKFEEHHQVRRRLWMTTVTRRRDCIEAKVATARELAVHPACSIFEDVLSVRDENSWTQCKLILYHNKLEVVKDAQPIQEIDLTLSEVSCVMPSHLQHNISSTEYPFALYSFEGNNRAVFKATDFDQRFKWIQMIQYQTAISSPLINFQPFSYGPPLGFPSPARTLLCGDLDVADTTNRMPDLEDTEALNWSTYQVSLQEQVLVINEKNEMKGRLLLSSARLDHCSTNKTIFVLHGHMAAVVLRASTSEIARLWYEALERQISWIALKSANEQRPFNDEEILRRRQEEIKSFRHPDWVSNDGELQEEEDYIAEELRKYQESLYQIWPIVKTVEPPLLAHSKLASTDATLTTDIHLSSTSTVTASLKRMSELRVDQSESTTVTTASTFAGTNNARKTTLTHTAHHEEEQVEHEMVQEERVEQVVAREKGGMAAIHTQQQLVNLITEPAAEFWRRSGSNSSIDQIIVEPSNTAPISLPPEKVPSEYDVLTEDTSEPQIIEQREVDNISELESDESIEEKDDERSAEEHKFQPAFEMEKRPVMNDEVEVLDSDQIIREEEEDEVQPIRVPLMEVMSSSKLSKVSFQNATRSFVSQGNSTSQISSIAQTSSSVQSYFRSTTTTQQQSSSISKINQITTQTSSIRPDSSSVPPMSASLMRFSQRLKQLEVLNDDEEEDNDKLIQEPALPIPPLSQRRNRQPLAIDLSTSPDEMSKEVQRAIEVALKDLPSPPDYEVVQMVPASLPSSSRSSNWRPSWRPSSTGPMNIADSVLSDRTYDILRQQLAKTQPQRVDEAIVEVQRLAKLDFPLRDVSMEKSNEQTLTASDAVDDVTTPNEVAEQYSDEKEEGFDEDPPSQVPATTQAKLRPEGESHHSPQAAIPVVDFARQTSVPHQTAQFPNRVDLKQQHVSQLNVVALRKVEEEQLAKNRAMTDPETPLSPLQRVKLRPLQEGSSCTHLDDGTTSTTTPTVMTPSSFQQVRLRKVSTTKPEIPQHDDLCHRQLQAAASSDAETATANPFLKQVKLRSVSKLTSLRNEKTSIKSAIHDDYPSESTTAIFSLEELRTISKVSSVKEKFEKSESKGATGTALTRNFRSSK